MSPSEPCLAIHDRVLHRVTGTHTESHICQKTMTVMRCSCLRMSFLCQIRQTQARRPETLKRWWPHWQSLLALAAKLLRWHIGEFTCPSWKSTCTVLASANYKKIKLWGLVTSLWTTDCASCGNHVCYGLHWTYCFVLLYLPVSLKAKRDLPAPAHGTDLKRAKIRSNASALFDAVATHFPERALPVVTQGRLAEKLPRISSLVSVWLCVWGCLDSSILQQKEPRSLILFPCLCGSEHE